MGKLTKEQVLRIEENRRKALEKRAQKEKTEANLKRAITDGVTHGTDHAPTSVQNPTTLTCVVSNKCQVPTIAQYFGGSGQVETPNNACQLPSTTQNLFINSYPAVNAHKFNCNPFNHFQKVRGGCHLVSEDRFCVDVGYHAGMIETFKQINSALYDSKSKKWTFHIKDHDMLIQKLQKLKNDVSISGVPKKILNIFRKPPVSYKNIDLTKVDPELVNNLMPFQKEGVQYGVSRRGRCLIADDMGLGKTIQGLGIAHYYYSDWPLLIVCPTSVRYQWMEAVYKWLPSVNQVSIFVMTSKNDFDQSAQVLITSYNLLGRHGDMISSCNFGVVIIDESHFLKAPKAARTKATSALLKKSKRVILLSGTPALSRPAELFTQLHAIDPFTFSHFQEFGIRYCDGRQTAMGFWNYNGSSNMKELQLVLQRSFMIRRMKSDVLAELPMKMRETVMLNARGASQSQEMRYYEQILQVTNIHSSDGRSTLLQYYAASGTYKLPAILDYVSDKLESGAKFIVFGHHQVVLDGICEIIIKKGISYIRIDGRVPSASRAELCDKFQHDEECMVAVLSITAANAGITLTAASLVIFAELFWNPGVLIQAEDRVHRIGQQDRVFVQYLVSRGTADDYLWPLIQTKLDVLNKAGLSKDNFQGCSTSSVTLENDKQKTVKDYFQKFSLELEDGNDEMLLQAAVDF